LALYRFWQHLDAGVFRRDQRPRTGPSEPLDLVYAGAPGVGVLRSTSYGNSFGPIGSGITAPIGRVSVAVSAAAPWHVYAISAIDVNGISRTLGGIWRSDDYGDGTWLQIESSDHISGAGQAFLGGVTCVTRSPTWLNRAEDHQCTVRSDVYFAVHDSRDRPFGS
jgi:hypothetical protein